MRRTPLFVTVLGIAALFGMYTESTDRLWEAHLLETFGLPGLGNLDPVVWFGIIGCAGLLATVGASDLLARRLPAGGRGSMRLLAALDCILLAGALVFALAGDFYVAVLGYLIATVARALDRPVFDAWLNSNIPSQQRATVLSIVQQSDAVGQWTGGPAIGAVGSLFSLRAALGAGALAMAPVVALYLRLLARGEEKEVLEEAGVSG